MNKVMGSKVVSTKLSEEEYGKLVGLCSASGDTVSKLLKRAILSSMNEEIGTEQRSTKKHVVEQKPQLSRKPKIKQTLGSDDRFLYY
jgi:hypothetical protein